MIREVSGDIMLTDCHFVAHSIAPLDHYDTGLALSLRERYPDMVKSFRQYCHTHHPKTGEIWAWQSSDGKTIINLLSQEPAPERAAGRPGKASISHVDHALKNLAKYIESHAVEKLAMPKIATGVGGLEWNEVKYSIDKFLGHLPCTIFVYARFVKGEKAKEG